MALVETAVEFWMEHFILVTVLSVMLYMIVKNSWENRHLPPGPWGLPIIGALFRLRKNVNKTLVKMAEKYGNIFSLKLGSELAVVLNGADAIREGLAKKSTFSGRPDNFIIQMYNDGGRGLFLANGRKYQMLRKCCHGELLKFLKTDLFKEQIEKEGKRLTKCIKKQHGQATDPDNLLKFATGNVILNMLFGSNYDYNNKEFLEVVHNEKLIQKLNRANEAVSLLPWLRPFYQKLLGQFREVLRKEISFVVEQFLFHKNTRSDNEVRSLSDCLLKVAQEENMKTQMSDGGAVEGDEGGAVGGDEDGGEQRFQISDKDLVFALRDLFASGFETSAETIRWALAIFVSHPHIQDRLHKELDEAFPSAGFPSVEDTRKLPYLQATLYEVLRFTSLSPLSIPHSSTADTTIAGYKIPKGTTIIPNLWSANRDPKAWKNPDVFDPERFLDKDGRVINLSSFPGYLPFSTGRRRCLGEDLVYMQVTHFLAVLLLNVRFSLEGLPEIDFNPREGVIFTLKPYKLRVEERRATVSTEQANDVH